MIVLDTHVWLWWLSGFERLSRKASRLIAHAIPQKGIYVSSISVWEVAQLVARRRLQLAMNVTDWLAKSEALPFVNFIPVDNAIAIKSVELPEPLHQDPADRIIIATALILGFPLVTKDRGITKYAHVRTIW